LIWGTIFGIYSIVLLSGAKGRYVFSDEYRRIIDATPHVKYRTSRATLIVLGILVAILIALFTAAAIFARQG
jgi:hypothetical protein